jgi:hypothetical protein
MFHPNDKAVWASALVTVPLLLWGIYQHRRIAPPRSAPTREDAPVTRGDLAPILAEAKRDLG